MRYRPVTALVAVLVLTMPASSRAAWQDDLVAEIRVSRGCNVAYLSQVVERTVDGRQVIFAKAHCEDGRVFDASRTDPMMPFELKECQPAKQPQAC